MKAHRPLMLLLCIAFLLCSCVGCNARSSADEESDVPQADGTITFNGRRFEFVGNKDAVKYEDDLLTIQKEGSYLLSGRLSEGRIRVSADGDVRLILGGAELNSSYGAVISREDGGRLIVESLPNTSNLLRSGAYRDTDNTFPTACVYSSGSLELLGDGSTVIDSNAECGVLSESRVILNGAYLTVKAEKYGVWVRDEFSFSSGKLTVSSARIGIYACGDVFSRGEIHISGGELVALCKDAVLWAGRLIKISGGQADVDSPVTYVCKREISGKVEEGTISIDAPGYPKIKTEEKPKNQTNKTEQKPNTKDKPCLLI